MKKFFLLFAAMMTATVMNLHATYYMAGNGSATNNWCCGINWSANGCAMTDGAYSTKVPAGTYEFKVTEGVWQVSYGYNNVDASVSTPGYEGSDNVKFTVASEANINVTFDGMYIVLTSDVPFGSATVTSWTIAGDEALLGSKWDPADTNNDMSLVGGAYQLVKKNVFLTEGGFDYKACANHSWGIKEVPASGNQTLQIDEDGTYDVTFTLDAQGTTVSAVAELPTPTPITVRLKESSMPKGWGDVAIYYWGDETTVWPGEKLTAVDGWYSKTFKATTTSISIIWNNNDEGKKTVDIADVQESTCYEITGGSGTKHTVGVISCEEPPVLTYDTAMFVAGNFTKWADEMMELPTIVNFPKDSTIEFKQVRRVITFTDSVPTDTALTWYGQSTKDYYMTRDNIGEGWTLNGEHNVLLTTDASGDYGFSIDSVGHFVVTFPEKPLQIFAKHNWDGGDWTWKEMIAAPEDIYNLDSVIFGGGSGFNINTKADDAYATWFPLDSIYIKGVDSLLAGDTITLAYNLEFKKLAAQFIGRPCAGEFGIRVFRNDSVEYIAGTINPEQKATVEYMVLGVALAQNDSVQLYDNCTKAGWADGVQYMTESYLFAVVNNKFVVDINGTFDFYFQLGSPDKLYVNKQQVTAIENTKAEKKNVKRIQNNNLYIYLGEHVYDAQGKMVK